MVWPQILAAIGGEVLKSGFNYYSTKNENAANRRQSELAYQRQVKLRSDLAGESIRATNTQLGILKELFPKLRENSQESNDIITQLQNGSVEDQNTILTELYKSVGLTQQNASKKASDLNNVFVSETKELYENYLTSAGLTREEAIKRSTEIANQGSQDAIAALEQDFTGIQQAHASSEGVVKDLTIDALRQSAEFAKQNTQTKEDIQTKVGETTGQATVETEQAVQQNIDRTQQQVSSTLDQAQPYQQQAQQTGIQAQGVLQQELAKDLLIPPLFKEVYRKLSNKLSSL